MAIGAHNDHDGISPETLDHDSLRAFNRLMRPEGANSTPGEPTAEQAAQIRAILDSLRKVRTPRPDSVLNGADDDGSGTVARAGDRGAAREGADRPKRSMLFVWHTAEEMGLLGSELVHPAPHRAAGLDRGAAQHRHDRPRPRGATSRTAVRATSRSSARAGSRPSWATWWTGPTREGKYGFTFDYQYDADGHPSNYYCRSDHYMYARFGIPIAFFTTGSHLDYHQLTDEPQYIDYDKMARVAQTGGGCRDCGWRTWIIGSWWTSRSRIRRGCVSSSQCHPERSEGA